MMIATALLLSLAPAQVATTTTAADQQRRTLAAMEKLAAAAQTAADAAVRSAAAAEKLAGIKPAAGAAAADAKPSPWTLTIGAGLIWLAGNSDQITFSANAAAQWKTDDWIFGAKASGVYGESLVMAGGATTVTALAAAIQLRGDRRFTERVTGYIAPGIETDHVKSIEYRASAEAGSGITWLEEIDGDFTKLSLRTDLAFRYSRESRYQYYPMAAELEDVELIAPRLGLAFRYGLSKDVIFTEDAEILPNIVGDARYLLNSLSKLSVRLTSVLSFAVALDIKHDSAPAAITGAGGAMMFKESTDSTLTIGLEASL